MNMVDRHVHKIFQAPELDATPVQVPSTIVIKKMGLPATSCLNVIFVNGDQLPDPNCPCPDQESHIILKGVKLEHLNGTRFIIGDVTFRGVELDEVEIGAKKVQVLRAAVIETGTIADNGLNPQSQILAGAELIPFNPAA